MEMELPFLFGAGLILLALFVLGFVGFKAKIPGIVLYLLLGIALAGVVGGDKTLALAGEIGIILLFFVLGMEFPMTRLANIAKKVWPAGLLDFALNFGVTALIVYWMQLDLVSSLLIGGVVYATSSSITAKLLESTKRFANDDSEFMLALLIFEDIVAPILIVVLVGMMTTGGLSGSEFGWLFLKVSLLFVVAIVLGRYVFSRMGTFVERYISEDFFVLLMVGISLAYGGLALYLDLSEVLGAFLAGIMLAETRKTEELEHMMIPIRDLFLPLFFVYFGSNLNIFEGIPMVGLLVVVFLWSIIGKILTGLIGGRLYGLTMRQSVRAGLSFTQRGEFSIIIAALATGSLKLFSGMFILFSAVSGMVLFLLAPRITNTLFGKKKKPARAA
ncbi:CPA2 family monovalent cation:H+ antiporter-2 [Desmospora profundinema]|uniref:CPA2 family monovalent cation:H+ antiporter-2 n=2 Tax=Desmospora profundinema TaxID=1571184 RepID=A0ABU1IML8_9BACL|nr:CPA2 family monovalent cation:H+ antiporter-2 [Desmospora profundinema]